MLKLDEPFRNQEIFINSFFNSSDLEFESKILFVAVFGWYVPWIHIFLRIRIRIQEAKILRIRRIRILSTGYIIQIQDTQINQTTLHIQIKSINQSLMQLISYI